MSEHESEVPDVPTPAEHEATGGDLSFEWAGEKFTLPPTPDDWDINVMRRARANDDVATIELLLGDQFERLEKTVRAGNEGRFTNADMKRVAVALFERYGFNPPGN